ncbi:MAG: HDOD domain-containing protein [Candidatus Hydrogenedentes bacterium]|nr:HDOD domain-containing protein [Candidatus Hydrogenedentota bacterium]
MKKPVDIDYLINEVITLPSLPSTVSRISDLLNDPTAPLSDVGKIIATDPAIALKTLRLVNSAYYGLATKVTSVEHAVVLLGVKVIKNLVFTATVFDTFKSGADVLLKHSVATGMAMQAMVESCGSRSDVDREGAFVFGLLHDIGKIILEEFLPEEFEQARGLAKRRAVPVYQVEREIIGVDHAEVGGRLAENWKLPPELINAISGHHDLSQCRSNAMRPLAAMLSVADYICVASGIPAETGAVCIVSDDIWRASGVTSRQVPAILGKFFAAVPGIDEICQVAA